MDNLEQRIACVHEDREHGSRWLVREAVSILYDLATVATLSPDEQVRQIRKAGRELAQARPAMGGLAVAVGRILSEPDGVAGMVREAGLLLEEYNHAVERIAAYACPLLRGTLMVHSLSGTVLEVLIACIGQIERVIVLEGRPRYEGREMARALAEHGVAVTLLTDAEADIFLAESDAVVVGADTVLANGDILNKAGTALLGWAARGHKVPFYVLCETLKISPRRWSDDLTQLEEKGSEEVLEQAIPGVTARNFYFDRTPARLITKMITEQGAMGRQEVRRIALKAMHMESSYRDG